MCYLLTVFGTLKAVVKLVWFLTKRSSELSALKTLIPLDLDICFYFIYLSVFFLQIKYNLNQSEAQNPTKINIDIQKLMYTFTFQHKSCPDALSEICSKKYISQFYVDFALNILKFKCLKTGTFIKGMFDPLCVHV